MSRLEIIHSINKWKQIAYDVDDRVLANFAIKAGGVRM